MSNTRIGVTLYTLRDFCKTPVDIADTLKKVKEMGYEHIQLSALGPIDPKELASLIDGSGLHVCATHVDYNRLVNDLDALLDEHRMWGCKHLAIGGMPDPYRSEKKYQAFAEDASVVAQKVQNAGFTFSYHNHHWELERHNGRHVLDILIEESDASLGFEIDTYWIQYGGGDPTVWIERIKDRGPIVHYKDLAIVDRNQVMAEVGEGNMNWPGINQACRAANVEWYVVEQDTCAGDPFDSIAISLKNMQAMGL